MQGGSGNDSYANNSQLQNYNFHAFAKRHLSQAIDQCIINCSPPTFRIADFGCSCGRNAVDYAEYIVSRLAERYETAAWLPSEVQYFFSDLPSNDFNNLFQTLELCRTTPHKQPGQAFPKFYAAGVPGSFHGRLFPKESLDLAISSYSLHWLSKVPPSVVDKTSPAWNGGHIWIHRDRPKVCQAYAQQFHVDVKNFLRCRAQELAKGAILFLFSVCRADEHPQGSYLRHYDTWCGYFESTWNEMVQEGLIGADERDLFNVPQYMFSRLEFEAALKDVPELQLVKIEVMEDKSNLPQRETQRQAFGKYWVGFMKSLTKPMVEAHIGVERAGEFFKRLQGIATERTDLTKNMAYDLLVATLLRA